MLCEYCKKGEVIEGTLEGISFQPTTESKKFFSSGVYGIKTSICCECGKLTELKLDIEALNELNKLIKK